jgi:hypothetical protein
MDPGEARGPRQEVSRDRHFFIVDQGLCPFTIQHPHLAFVIPGPRDSRWKHGLLDARHIGGGKLHLKM